MISAGSATRLSRVPLGDHPEVVDLAARRGAGEHLAHEGPGAEDVDPDPPIGPFHGHGPGEVLEAGLRGAVGADVGTGPVGGHGADVHDAAAAPVAHHRRDLLAHAQWALEIHREDLAPVVEGHLAHRHRRRVDAGVVDQHVDTAEPVDDLLDEPGDGVPVTDVAGEGEHLGAGGGPDLLGHLVAQLLLAGADHDLGAGRGQSLDHGPADALGGAGDDGHLAGEVEHIGTAHLLGLRSGRRAGRAAGRSPGWSCVSAAFSRRAWR